MYESILQPMIIKRKSIRLISTTPIAVEIIHEILLFAENIKPVFPNIQTSFKILSNSEIMSLGSVYAPHYLAVYSEKTPDAELNIGFILQHIDLFLSSKGLGSCWLGMAKPLQAIYNDLSFIILIAFGISVESVHRTSIYQYKRKPLHEIALPGVVPAYINFMRVAPSAMNKQPWFFTGEESFCHAFSVHGTGLINLAESWRFVDLGIALSHLSISALADGNSVRFKREDSIPSRLGCEYIISCHLD